MERKKNGDGDDFISVITASLFALGALFVVGVVAWAVFKTVITWAFKVTF